VTGPFIPPYPPRGSGPVPIWRGFFGERAKNAVYGWSEAAFRIPQMRREVLGYTVHIPLDPELIQHVLLDNVANYAKPDIVKGLLAPVIGRGLLTSDGPLWRDQRRIVAANFAPAAVDALVPAFVELGREAMSWSEGVHDMAEQATVTTMRIIAATLFGGDPRLTSDAALRHIAAALNSMGEARLPALLGLPIIPYTPKMLSGQRGQIYLRQTLTDVVRDRLPDGGAQDFLGRLIRTLSERFEPEEAFALAVDNAATFYIAGHETTANAVTWALFLLSEQPELQDEAAAEARVAIEAGADDPDLPDRLPLLRRILEETLRLYPPVPRLDRQAVAEDRLGEEKVEVGHIVSIWPWLLHRHKKLWDEPDAFDASRFGTDAKAARHRFQYIPFGAGPRVCVGARFATAEALAVLAHWLSQWRFSPVPGREVRPSGMVTLRPAEGLPLRLNRR
jgi:cytochrome P450